ncbi:MAG: SusC/RagA family TonB-linked outer membrane protein, partial [Duncaniella sp.]|uniref:SusC/RagA family TonB-linked outer membrane protein n=1 Tax=Duncaniella sp. TaxID=2518496 RepID=UPI0023C335EF|nr:SusC/RagA family TonB-linked outer membrane protein [Duncaniella sp.]
DGTNMLDEVITVAYGTAKRSAFTGSASVLDASQIEAVQVTNPVDALKGKVSGVQINSQSGAPGNSTPTVRIRGISSINAGNSPLIVLDGTPYDGGLDNISTQDIETMTVLKDAASNALYGARGANGVILITTKKGKSGDARVTLDAKWGQNSRAISDYDVITSPAQYYETFGRALGNYAATVGGYDEAKALAYANQNLIRQLGYNVYSLPEGENMLVDGYKLNPNATLGNLYTAASGEQFLMLPDSWADAAYKNSLRQEYNLSVSQGTDRGSFYASASYLNNEGITINSGYERFTGRLSADLQAKKWLKIGSNFSYTHYESKFNGDDGESSSSGNVFTVNNVLAPIYPLYVRDPQGNIMKDSNNNTIYDYGDGMGMGLPSRPVFSQANPLSQNTLDVSKYNGNAVTATGYAEIRFLRDFKFTSNNTVNMYEQRRTGVTNPFYGQYASSNGIVNKYSTRRIDYTYQQLLNYAREFGAHNLNVLLGHETYWNRYSYLYASRSNMLLPGNEELDGAVLEGGSSSYEEEYNNEGWFGRVNYDYDSKYFGSVSLRRDASSRFDPDHRWGTFWSASAAWIINKESFFNAPWVDMLKIKASYGEQGNDNIGNFRYTDTYTIVNAGGHPAAIPNTLGNKNISWEKGGNLNYGVDFALFNERLTGTVEGFYRKTSDMLFSFPLPPSYGYTSYYDNIGDMTNTGFEIDLHGDIIRTRDITWSMNFNLTYYKNKITRLPEERKTMTVDGVDGYSSGSYFYGEGESLYTYRVKRFAGVDKETGSSLWYYNVKDEKGNPTGELKTTSVYGNGDFYLCGTALPDVYGGFGTSVNAYGFDLSIDFNYQLGGQVYDGTYANLMASPYSSRRGYAMHKDLLSSWTPENKNSNIPYMMYSDQYVASTSDRFLTSASYLALQNINFGYTVPTNLTKKMDVERIRFYLSCDNVALWSKRKGLDPRQSITGSVTNAYYAPIRTISGGINISF